VSSIFALLPKPRLLTDEFFAQSAPKAEGGAGALADSMLSTFKEVMGEVNRQQFHAEDMTRAFAAGDVQDVHDVALAINKAKFALDFTVRVRDRMLEAYRELSMMR